MVAEDKGGYPLCLKPPFGDISLIRDGKPGYYLQIAFVHGERSITDV